MGRLKNPDFWILITLFIGMTWIGVYSGGHILSGMSSFIACVLTILLLLISAWKVWVGQAAKWYVLGGVILPWLVYTGLNYFYLSTTPWFGEVILAAYSGAYVTFLCVLYLDEKYLKSLFVGVVVLVSIFLLIGFLQMGIGSLWHPLNGVGSVLPQYRGRISSLFAIPNSFACFLLMVLPYPLLSIFLKKKWQLLNGLLLVLIMWSLIATISRAAIMTAIPIVCLSCFFSCRDWQNRVFRSAFVLTIYGVIFALVSLGNQSERRFSDLAATGGESCRVVYYASAHKMFVDSPMLGAGFGNFQTIWDTQLPVNLPNSELFMHSDYLQVLSETGIVGASLLFGAITIVLIRVFLRLKSRSHKVICEDSDFYIKVALCGLLGFGMQLLVNFESKIICILLLASIYLATIVRYSSEVREWRMSPHIRIFSSGLICMVALSMLCFLAPRMFGVGCAADGESNFGRVQGFHSMGLPAPVEEVLEVERALNKAVKWHPSYQPAYRLLAKIKLSHLHSSDSKVVVKESAFLMDKAIEMYPQQWRLWEERGAILALDLERLSEAKSSYKMALQLAPYSTAAQYKYAQFLAKYESSNSDELRTILEGIVMHESSARYYPAAQIMLDELNQ